MIANVQFCLLSSEVLVPILFNSRIVRTHFASIMALNNSDMIVETQSYISDNGFTVIDVVFA